MTTAGDIMLVADKIFESYDQDDSGYLDRAEVKTVITTLFKEVNKKTIVTDKKLNQLFSTMDKDSNDRLSRKEFR
jgi:Ca2+-binding EF-hand superfamily protein